MGRLIANFRLAVRLAVLLPVFALVLPAPARPATDNSGLGPFAIRSLFPPALPFLDFMPEQARTIPESDFRITYQYALSNTFFNTESPTRSDLPDPITPEDVEIGLTEDDFQPTGYGLFIDVEVERHLFALRYGLSDDLEIGADLAWVSFGSGQLDGTILQTEKFFNAVNQNLEVFQRDQFAYYVIYNGEFVHATDQPFEFEPQDPVFSLKWNVGKGGDFLPAMGIKLAYKLPLDSSPEGPAGVVNNGEAEFGYSVILTKRLGGLVTHFQVTRNQLNDPKNRFESERTFRMFTAELQTSQDFAYLAQVVSQTRLFHFPVNRAPGSREINISRPTDLLTLGVKYGRRGFLFSAGVVEDINSAFNETDVAAFLELGWQW